MKPFRPQTELALLWSLLAVRMTIEAITTPAASPIEVIFRPIVAGIAVFVAIARIAVALK